MPTVTDWITALTAILALGAAVWAGHSAYQVNRPERERDLEAEWRRRSEQAAGINAWCVVRLEFTDSAGAHWRRDHHGVLTAAPDAEAAR